VIGPVIVTVTATAVNTPISLEGALAAEEISRCARRSVQIG